MKTETIYPKNVKNLQYHIIGAGLLVLNAIRHKAAGYTTPRTFPMHEIDRAVEYDFSVVEGWIQHLFDYSDAAIKEKVILEPGPGADLGIGLILLAMGAKKYIAVDVNGLARDVPVEFYDKLFDQIKAKYSDCDVGYLRVQLDKCLKGEESDLCYVVDENFEISKINQPIDIVFSQAAFEHFVDIEKTIQELSDVVKKGGLLITEVDLKTHTRWIKDQDPLSIYRYSDFFWNMCKFNGSPNRVRAGQYKDLLEKNNWEKVKIEPVRVLESEYVDKVKPSLNKKFKKMAASEIQLLSIMLMAEKK